MAYKQVPIHKTFSLHELIANSATHALGVGLSIAGLVTLIIKAGRAHDPWYLGSVIVYGISLILLYMASTVYHSTPESKLNGILQRLDHSMIFVLIAGTYTPFMLTSLRGLFGYLTLALVWLVALGVLIAKLVLTDRFTKPPVWLYVVMGWFAVIVFGRSMADIGTASIIFLIVGGLFYTSGIIFYRWKKLPYAHAIWHLFVIGGSVFHFFSVLQLV